MKHRIAQRIAPGRVFRLAYIEIEFSLYSISYLVLNLWSIFQKLIFGSQVGDHSLIVTASYENPLLLSVTIFLLSVTLSNLQS